MSLGTGEYVLVKFVLVKLSGSAATRKENITHNINFLAAKGVSLKVVAIYLANSVIIAMLRHKVYDVYMATCL